MNFKGDNNTTNPQVFFLFLLTTLDFFLLKYKTLQTKTRWKISQVEGIRQSNLDSGENQRKMRKKRRGYLLRRVVEKNTKIEYKRCRVKWRKKLSFKNLRVKITSPNILISLQSVDIHASECKRVSEPSPFGVLINTATGFQSTYLTYTLCIEIDAQRTTNIIWIL